MDYEMYSYVFPTLEYAKRVCDNYDNCIAVEVNQCNNTLVDNFWICKAGSTFESSEWGNCIYVKT